MRKKAGQAPGLQSLDHIASVCDVHRAHWVGRFLCPSCLADMHHPLLLSWSGLAARRVLCVVGAAVLLGACSAVGDEASPRLAQRITPYQMDMQQGNVVTREQTQALRPGLSRTQVADILGSPLLTSVFHADRWDYVFTFQRQGQTVQQRRLTVFFKGDALDRFEGDELPTEADFVASLQVQRNFKAAPPLQATEAQLQDFQTRNARSPQPAAPAVPPGTTYPPLEPSGSKP